MTMVAREVCITYLRCGEGTHHLTKPHNVIFNFPSIEDTCSIRRKLYNQGKKNCKQNTSRKQDRHLAPNPNSVQKTALEVATHQVLQESRYPHPPYGEIPSTTKGISLSLQIYHIMAKIDTILQALCLANPI